MQRADETAASFDGDRQSHSRADDGVREAEYDCHTVGNGQSKVISNSFNLIFSIKMAAGQYLENNHIQFDPLKEQE